MRRISTTCVAAMLLALAASISPCRLPGQTAPIAPQEPSALGELFSVDQATGALAPLEHVKTKTLPGKIQSGGFLQPRVQMVELYFEGRTSPVTFKAGQPMHFLVRLMSPADRYGQELTAEHVGWHFSLARLVVQNAKNHEGRFITKAVVPLNVETIGAIKLGLDAKHPDRAAQSFLLTPQTPLVPGPYHIWIAGMHDYELVANAMVGEQHWAFDIVPR